MTTNLSSVPPLAIPVITTGTPLLEMQSGPTDYPRILEISIYAAFNAGNNSSLLNVGLGVPAVKGRIIGPQTATQEDGGDTGNQSNVVFGVNWSLPPTAPTTFFRRYTQCLNNPAAAGYAQIRLRFPNGIMILPSSSLVLWAIQIVTVGAFDASVVIA